MNIKRLIGKFLSKLFIALTVLAVCTSFFACTLVTPDDVPPLSSDIETVTPVTPDPDESNPSNTTPEDPDPVKPDPTEPDPEKPEPIEPKPVKPEPEKPKPIEPDPEKPDPIEPEPIEPEPVKPEPVEPEPVEPEPPTWSTEYGLPDADGAMQKLVEIYGGTSKVFLLQNNRIARMPCPRGEVITLNFTFEVGEYAKLVLEDSVSEFNEVFGVINPNYKFAINYDPTDDDFNAKYSVRMSHADKLSVSNTGEVFGFAHISYYSNYTELGDFAITIRSDVFDNGAYLMTTFKHELMHLLGAGDAYNNPNATKATIMQSYTVNGYHGFSSTDVAMLDALYRNPAAPYDNEYVADYIANYETTTTHTRASMTATVYKHMMDNLDHIAVYEQAAKIGYADISGFAEKISNGIFRDNEFGTYKVSFTELTYVVRPESTYYGSIDGATYWHGKQTTLDSSHGIKFTDYGDGLIYSAPNGNLYTLMIRVGNYVILFDLHGSFTSLPDLSVTVRTVCSIK